MFLIGVENNIVLRLETIVKQFLKFNTVLAQIDNEVRI